MKTSFLTTPYTNDRAQMVATGILPIGIQGNELICMAYNNTTYISLMGVAKNVCKALYLEITPASLVRAVFTRTKLDSIYSLHYACLNPEELLQVLVWPADFPNLSTASYYVGSTAIKFPDSAIEPVHALAEAILEQSTREVFNTVMLQIVDACPNVRRLSYWTGQD